MRQLRLLLLTALAVGVVTGLVFGLLTRDAVIGLILGVILAFTVGFAWMQLTVRTRGNAPDLATTREQELRLPQPPFAASATIAAELAGCGVRRIRPGPYGFTGRTGTTALGLGELVEVRLRPDQYGPGTAVLVSSRSRTPLTKADYRRNEDNVRRIADAISRAGPLTT